MVLSNRVALYARTSTSKQDPGLQTTELRQVAAQRGWNVVVERVDQLSGKRASRPGIDEIRELARRGKLDAVVVWRLDRLGRNLRNFLDLLEEFRAAKVNIISLREGFDLETPMGRAMAQILALLAELEGEWNKERVLAGLEEARRKGKRLGRRPLEVDVDHVLELHSNGRSVREIARELDVARSVVHRALTAPPDGVCVVCGAEVQADLHGRARWHFEVEADLCDGFGQAVLPLPVPKTPSPDATAEA
jgi:DNA invertase Pin-like site-specific DNA recombinase